MQEVTRSQGDVIKSFRGEEKRKEKREEALSVSVCVSPESYPHAPPGVTDVTTKSEQYLAPRGQVELEPAKPSSWSASGALLGDERCGNSATSPDPVLSGVYVYVCVCEFMGTREGASPPD